MKVFLLWKDREACEVFSTVENAKAYVVALRPGETPCIPSWKAKYHQEMVILYHHTYS